MQCNLSQSTVGRNKSAQFRQQPHAAPLPEPRKALFRPTTRLSTAACLGIAVLMILPALSLTAAELHIGGATVSITPEQPVALSGQMHARIARTVESPVTATALALESREGDKVLDQTIMVSCDLVAIREGIQDKVRERIQARIPDFDGSKLVMNATHTHTAPVMREDTYELPAEGIMQPKEYVKFLADRVADAAVQAWQSRRAGSVGWGLGHAIVAQNRRSTYANGTAQMYGATNKADFRGIEGRLPRHRRLRRSRRRSAVLLG